MKIYLSLTLALLTIGCNQIPKAESYLEDWSDLDRYPQAEWLGEAKFGLYFHWNYNSIAGCDGWYGRHMYKADSKTNLYHREHFGDPETFGYKDFEPLFTASEFSAQEWVDNVERSGGKFIVGMAVHHDGFDLYNSSYTKWNSVDKLPHIDIIGELEREARLRDMKFGATTHLAWNWQYFSRYMYPDNYDACQAPELYNIHDPDGAPSAEFAQEWYDRTTELINNYQLDFLWFDFGTQDPAFCDSLTRKLTAHYYNKSVEWGKQVAMASKFGFENKKSRVIDCEQGKFGYIKYPMWMSDCTMNEGWFYTGNIAAKGTEATGKYWTHQLIDIVSKNGTLLLNVGPVASGAWPEEFKSELFKMGDWLRVNGEAIYSSTPWHRYGEGVNHFGDGSHYNLGECLTSDDIRFTRKGNALYAIVCGWGDGDISIGSLGQNEIPAIDIQRVSCLASDQRVEWGVGADALHVKLPRDLPRDQFAYVLKIEGKGLFPERRDEYEYIEIPIGVSAPKRARITLKGEGTVALSEVILFDKNHSVKKLKVTASSCDATSPLSRVIDGNANQSPSQRSIAKTQSESNPYMELEIGYAKELTRAQIFPAHGHSRQIIEGGILEVFDKDGAVIFTTELKDYEPTKN
ncbi:MAG: alpha-L-fucosidase [Rikenellaceae bacterium]